MNYITITKTLHVKRFLRENYCSLFVLNTQLACLPVPGKSLNPGLKLEIKAGAYASGALKY